MVQSLRPQSFYWTMNGEKQINIAKHFSREAHLEVSWAEGSWLALQTEGSSSRCQHLTLV